MTDQPRADAGAEAALADELMQIHVESYGKGAGSAHVYIHDDLVIAILDDLQLQRSEEFLIDAGHGDSVTEVRHHFQQAIETTFRAAVERVIGRRVTSFASITKLSPNYVVEIFRLGDQTEQSIVEPPSDAA